MHPRFPPLAFVGLGVSCSSFLFSYYPGLHFCRVRVVRMIREFRVYSVFRIPMERYGKEPIMIEAVRIV